MYRFDINSSTKDWINNEWNLSFWLDTHRIDTVIIEKEFDSTVYEEYDIIQIAPSNVSFLDCVSFTYKAKFSISRYSIPLEEINTINYEEQYKTLRIYLNKLPQDCVSITIVKNLS